MAAQPMSSARPTTPAPPRASLGPVRIALRPGFTLLVEDGIVMASTAMGTLGLGAASAGLEAAIGHLVAGDRTADEVADLVAAVDGAPGLTRLYLLLGRIASLSALDHHVTQVGAPIATLEPTGGGLRVAARAVDPAVALTLSRFAALHADAGSWVLGSSLGHGQVRLHHPGAVTFVTSLATPRHPVAFAEDALGLEPATVDALLQLLLNAETLTAWRDGAADEERDLSKALWAAHDLEFHVRSRFGRQTGPFGAGFRHLGAIPPLPAVRPLPPGPGIDLPRPDLDDVIASDPPFSAVLETRRSFRPDGTDHITLEELGTFLYRAARVRTQDVMEVCSVAGRVGTMEVTGRPYPTGGRTYELELWLSVARCDGLEPGLHHYDPLGHRLTFVRPRDRRVEPLLAYVGISAPGAVPSVVVHLAARFGRVSWKYDAMAYATIQKHVGVLYQTMYLVATAMGLGACALGSGDPDAFAAAAGTDPLVEASVGDFLLSGRPTASDGTITGQRSEA